MSLSFKVSKKLQISGKQPGMLALVEALLMRKKACGNVPFNNLPVPFSISIRHSL
jgi:hypothetical protein